MHMTNAIAKRPRKKLPASNPNSSKPAEPAKRKLPYQCTACDLSYATRTGLSGHVYRNHPDVTLGTWVQADGKVVVYAIPQHTVQCAHCSKTFVNRIQLHIHLDKMHQIGKVEKEIAWFRNHKCKETSSHLLKCPSLAPLREKHHLVVTTGPEYLYSVELAEFLCDLFDLPPAVKPQPRKQRKRTPQAGLLATRV
ncbi:hypothetical protein STCU_06962 [Strigomonas culicis]|uniref:C2H2-type domain-containing protein n=1 Tax=Strigomonas culicis TaxID=28005 RepID=S9U257_9TRYP|nr:hypothetical protein STCU_06962 [Strigomonas culicis]|eukprot:EPY24872.1 hypothetical protein STCU_06962 [Strigomonas culicis]